MVEPGEPHASPPAHPRRPRATDLPGSRRHRARERRRCSAPVDDAPAASYAASKVAAPNRVTCEYDAVAYYESDADAAWTRLASRRLAYFIGMDGDYAVPDTAIHRTLNQLNGPILKRVETSELFRPEPGIPEDLRVRVFRRIDRVADGRALSDRGRHEEAIAELTRATVLDPADVEAWATLALAHATRLAGQGHRRRARGAHV